jgi:malate synthase
VQVWTGLMKGDVSTTFNKGGKAVVRTLNPDRKYTAPDGSELVLPGRYADGSAGAGAFAFQMCYEWAIIWPGC